MKRRRWAEVSGTTQGKNFGWCCLFLQILQLLFDAFMSACILYVTSKLFQTLVIVSLEARHTQIRDCCVCFCVHINIHAEAMKAECHCELHTKIITMNSPFTFSLYFRQFSHSPVIFWERQANYKGALFQLHKHWYLALWWQLVEWCSCYA